MSDTIYLTIDGLDELEEGLKRCQKEMPDLLFSYLRKAGNRFKREYLERMKSRTKEHTGNLYKGARATVEIQKGSLTKFENNIRGGSKKTKAPHFWLVENGHRGFVPDRSGTLHYIGEVKGKFAMEDTRNDWKNSGKLVEYARKALDTAIEKGLNV
jgi:hypothetical protein